VDLTMPGAKSPLCDVCALPLRTWRATRARPYSYVPTAGVRVPLIGITVHECRRCRAPWPVLPRIEALHRAIAAELVDKPGPLTGPELRYLRKFAGFTGQAFARRLKVSNAHLSRVEHGTLALGESAEQLARAIAAAVAETDVRAVLLRAEAGGRPRRAPLVWGRQGWRRAA
jgi:DNA-binding transcriptional regulator YiaG